MSLEEGKIVHRCDICGTKGTWDENWSSYGSFKDFEDYGREGVVIVCSLTCKTKVNELIKKHGDLRAKDIKSLIPQEIDK